MGKIKYAPTAFADPMADALAEPSEMAPVHDDGGRVRLKKFSYTATAALAASSTLVLCQLPKASRVVGGAIAFSAFGVGRTLDLGLVGADASGNIDDATPVADDVDFYLDGIDVSGAGQDTFGDLASGDGNALYLSEKDVLLLATVLGDTMPLAGWIVGYVLYAVD